MGTGQQPARNKDHEKVHDSETRTLRVVSNDDLRGRSRFVSKIIRHVLLTLRRYNKLSREIRDVAERIKALDPKDPFRNERGAQLLEKL